MTENDGEVLRKFLSETDSDFITLVFQDEQPFTRQLIENRSDLQVVCDKLERINMNEKKVTQIL